MFDDPPAPRATPPEDRSPRHYRELFDANPLPTWAFDRETLAFLEVNQSAIDHYGYSRAEFLAMTIADIRPPEDVQRLFEDLGELAPVSDIDTWRHRAKDGRIIHVSLRGKDFWFDGVAARLVVAHDITAQLEAEQSVRRLDAQLNQAQKLEAIGRLSGGMAHDFNNILTAVLGYAGFLVAALPPDGLLHEDALEIERAGRRGADLTRQLLAFSRKQAIAPTVLPLEDVIDGITSMLRRLLGEDVRLTSSSDGGPHMVKADRCQLEQVLLNLAVNARDAMPDGGDLRIETTRVDGDGDAGPHVALRVTDTGCGMDDDTRRQIFEPFFTSKEPGKGTGLGLATVYGIVQQSGGRIDVRSAPGQGTTFEILLPRTSAVARAVPAPRPRISRIGPAVILLVDDDPAVRTAARRALAASHRVLEAATVEEARALCAHGGPIDLLLTDVVMPGTNGIALAAELVRVQPAMKVMFMSGHPDHPSGRAARDPGVPIVEKPFGPADLLDGVNRALHGG